MIFAHFFVFFPYLFFRRLFSKINTRLKYVQTSLMLTVWSNHCFAAEKPILFCKWSNFFFALLCFEHWSWITCQYLLLKLCSYHLCYNSRRLAIQTPSYLLTRFTVKEWPFAAWKPHSIADGIWLADGIWQTQECKLGALHVELSATSDTFVGACKL